MTIRKLKTAFISVFSAALMFSVFNAGAQDLKQALRYTNSEQFESAKEAYEKLLAEQPNNAEYLFYYGDNFLRSYLSDTLSVSFKDMADAARIQFKKAIEADATNPMGLVGLGKIAWYSGSLDEARKLFADAEATFPSKTNKTSTLAKDKQALALMKMAETLITPKKSKDVNLAMKYISQAAELDPSNAEIFLIYGDVYLESNDGTNAISQYKMAQDLNPQSPSAKVRLGKLWVRARNWAEAISYYNEALQIDPDFAPAYLELGIIYSRANQHDKSKQNFVKYLQISTNISARIKYASVLIESGDYAEAVIQLTEIMKIDSSRNDLNRALAYSYFETGKNDEALKYIEKFFRLSAPEKIIPSDYAYYGKILSKAGQDSVAIINFRKAYELDTSRHDLLTDIAGAFNKMKKYNEAAAAYEQKIALGKAGLADYYRLGLVYYNMKEWAKCDRSFGYITENKPDFMSGKAYYWRGLANTGLDPELDSALAKPYFEKYIEIAIVDSVKNAKDLVICFDYMGYYHFKNKDYCNAIMFWQKIVSLDAKNEKALSLLKDTKGKCPERE